ncbi:hypothetical protein KKA15_06130 [Patescibacteria group bacterium]|nr:hypothetical protein [Patescibacteria group bacterium]
MNFEISSETTIDVRNFFRNCGYHIHDDRRAKQQSFVRRLSSNFYPRFHIYLKSETKDKIICSLHLDQKKVKLGKQIIHAGDYDNDLLKEEIQRIQANLA